MRKTQWIQVVAATAFALIAAACSQGATGTEVAEEAFASTPSGFGVEVLGQGLHEDAKFNLKAGEVHTKIAGDVNALWIRVVIAPGGESGWHTHPGPVKGFVVSGAFTDYEGSDPCNPTTVSAGQGFVEQDNEPLGHNAINEGTEDVVLYAVIDYPTDGTPPRIEKDPVACTQ